ncbi:MAG: hypothetical protein MJ211_07855 [Bacteroidales bacterium]|nr:hypothetical protein [Bacteroidales bacterium]
MDEFQPISNEIFRKIISTVRTLRNVDFTMFAPDILMHRINRSMNLHGIQFYEKLINKLMVDNCFVDLFLSEIFVPTTEMFRDDTMWKFLEEHIISKLKHESICKIWVPQICGDDELYSLLILLHRNGMLDKSTVYATSPIQKILDDAKIALIDPKKFEASDSNFKKINDKNSLTIYLSHSDKYEYILPELLNKVIFLRHNILNSVSPDNAFNLVLFRDRMLYLNSNIQKMVLENFASNIVKGGYLITGIREKIPNDFQNVFVPVSKNENIFVKV